MAQAPTTWTTPEVVMARQPIFDADLRLAAFELLYRTVGDNDDSPAGDRATATVLVGALTDVGLARLVGSQRAYLNVNREFLLAFRPLPLPADRVVLELVEDQVIDAELLDVLAELVEDGFTLALDNFDYRPELEPLLRFASVAKLDIQALDRDAQAEHVRRLHELGLTVIAEKVETREELEHCRRLGVDGFQGFFFERPAIVSGRPTPTFRMRALAELLDTEDEDLDALERLISHDAGISHKLLRLTNSAHVSPRSEIRSIRHALALLGGRTVRRWAMLFLLSESRGHSHELLVTALVRAGLCEMRAQRDGNAEPDRAFTVGLFSVADALLQTTMPELLQELPFDERTTEALLDHVGPEGRILRTVLAYERGRFDEHDVSGLSEMYYDSVEWATETVLQLG
jgi:c-di-GMP phosphodiesterase